MSNTTRPRVTRSFSSLGQAFIRTTKAFASPGAAYVVSGVLCTAPTVEMLAVRPETSCRYSHVTNGTKVSP